MTPFELRQRRIAAEISASLLAATSKVNRSRLSNIERGYVQPTEQELARLTAALDSLVGARSELARFAASVGWPPSKLL